MYCLFLLNLLFPYAALRQYGDTGVLENFIGRGEIFPRWYLGNAILNFLYRSIWLPFAPAILSGPERFVQCAGSFCTLLSTLALLRWQTPSAAIFGVVLSPLWLLFLSGYSEYYPFIAGPFAIGLVWLLQRELTERSPIVLGIGAGLYSLAYVAFVPVSFLVLACLSLRSWKDGLCAVSVAILVVVLVVVAVSGTNIAEPLVALSGQLNLNSENIPRSYQRLAVEGLPLFRFSALFNGNYVLQHLYMLMFSGGAAGALTLVFGFLSRSHAAQTWLVFLGSSRGLLCAGILLFEISYFLFMMPCLGTRRDIDLFFQAYFAFAIIGGRLLEWDAADSSSVRTVRSIMAAALIGHCVVSAYLLLIAGLPKV